MGEEHKNEEDLDFDYEDPDFERENPQILSPYQIPQFSNFMKNVKKKI